MSALAAHVRCYADLDHHRPGFYVSVVEFRGQVVHWAACDGWVLDAVESAIAAAKTPWAWNSASEAVMGEAVRLMDLRTI